MYYKLNTRPFLHTTDNQRVTFENLKQVLNNHYDTAAFSIFPYLNEKKNSKKCIENNAGNCISLSMRIQDILKNKNKNKKPITSFLIPSTIPSTFNRDGYQPITHVALFVYVNSRYGYIIDPAFYFTEPIRVDLRTDAPGVACMRNIHTESDDIVNYNTYQFPNRVDYSEYQRIPKDTLAVNCNFEKDTSDKWSYILREITNPDKAISSFYVNLNKMRPFIMSTKVTDEGLKQDCAIHKRKDNQVEIKQDNTTLFYGDVDSIPPNLKTLIKEKLGKYFKDGVVKLEQDDDINEKHLTF